MAASKPHGVMAPTSLASISLQMESESPPPKLADLALFLGFEIDGFQSFIGEVSFGVGAKSMTAGQPHGGVAPTSSTSTSMQAKSESASPPKLADLA